MKAIDEKAYQQGMDMFKSKVTLRQLIQPLMERAAKDELPIKGESAEDREARREKQQVREMSVCLGFADAFLDKLRKL